MLSKNFVIVFISSLFIVCTLPCTLFLIYDPLSVFHVPFAREFTLIDNMRKQNIALMRHINFDSLIIGNSHTDNTSAREAGEAFGGSFINLSMDASTMYERSLVLDYAFRHTRIKTVVGMLTENTIRDGHNDFPLSEWSFLYDDSKMNDIMVYLNTHYLMCLAAWSTSPQCLGTQKDMDRPASWFENPNATSRFGGLDKWITHNRHVQLAPTIHDQLPEYADKPVIPFGEKITPNDQAAVRRDIDEFIVQPAKRYQDTRFLYFFSPYSLLHRAMTARTNGLNLYLFWVKETVRTCADLDNVELYFFDNEPFTEDLQYYIDIGHYSHNINSFILQSMRLGQNRLGPDNVDEQLRLLAARAAAYDLKATNDYIQENVSLIERQEKQENEQSNQGN